jgi:hypothetical protein
VQPLLRSDRITAAIAYKNILMIDQSECASRRDNKCREFKLPNLKMRSWNSSSLRHLDSSKQMRANDMQQQQQQQPD